MSRIPNIKKISKEDFPDDIQETIDKLAYPLNSFMEQTRAAFDGNIDFSNLNQEIIVLDVTVDASGVPLIVTQYKSDLNTRVIGHTCISATNVTNPLNTPTSCPFISFVLKTPPLVQVNKISGLQANERYSLTFISFGQSAN